MSEYSVRVQVLLTVKLKEQLEAYKEKYGFSTDSMAIRVILKEAFNNE